MRWWKRTAAMTWARTLEFLRDRATLGWNLFFPLVMVVGFAVVFSGPAQPLFKVAVLADQPIESLQHPVLDTPQVFFYRVDELADSLAKLKRHRIDLLLDFRDGARRYWINAESPKGSVLVQLIQGAGGDALQAQAVEGKAIRYVDWVMPGLLGMNMMFSCLFGIGYVIVRYRKSGYLKRLQATPLTALEFVVAQLASRLLLIMTITCSMFAGLNLVLDFRVDGSYLSLLIVTFFGATAMMSLGLLVAARVASEEFAGGLLNLVSWPMMILSGVFYSLDGAPEVIQRIAECFPLTQLLNGAREVMLDGASLLDIADHVAVLAGMSIVFLLLGAAMFRWNPE